MTFYFHLFYLYLFQKTFGDIDEEKFVNRVKMVFKNRCVLVLWTKVASALEGIIETSTLYGSLTL